MGEGNNDAAKDSSTKTVPVGKFSWLNRTNLYGFELFMACFGILTAAYVIDWGIFTFLNYVTSDSNLANRSMGEVSLWVAAAMLVWLPIALIFYLRSRGQMLASPQRTGTVFHKVIVSIYLFFNIVSAAGAAFVVLYSLIRLMIGEGDVTEVLLQVSLPALLMTSLHIWLMFAFSKHRFSNRKVFTLVFGGVGVVVTLALLISSVGGMRAAVQDEKRVDDLRAIEGSMRSYYREDQRLPDSLADLDIDEDRLEKNLDEYSYVKQGLNRYELCTTFASDTTTSGGRSTPAVAEKDYPTYGRFGTHGKGEHCFKLSAGYLNYPLNDSRRDY